MIVTSACQGGDASSTGSCGAPFDEAAVRGAFEAQRTAWNTGDIDGFLGGYERSEALIFTSGAKVRRGYEQLASGFKQRYGEAQDSMGTLGFELLDVRPLGSCRDAAVVLGRWKLEGGEADGSGVFSVLLERTGDAWLIVHDHTSSDPRGH